LEAALKQDCDEGNTNSPRVKVLGETLLGVLIGLGVVHPEASMTGPELIAICPTAEQLRSSLDREQQALALLRELQRVIQCSIFGTPAMEVVKWNQKIADLLDRPLIEALEFNPQPPEG